jgi:hypothetical protein
MIPRHDFQRLLESNEIDTTSKEAKEMNKANEFLEYIEKGAPVAVALPKAAKRKRVPEWLISHKQRRGIHGR